MIRKTIVALLLCGSAFSYSGTALAQDAEPDASDATADAAIASAAPVDDAQAKIELLQAQVEALQEALEGIKAQMTTVTPSWKGAPLFEDKEAGWSFKPRGRLMYDFATVSSPEGHDNAGLGFTNEVRRARLGVEGTIPGDIGYKFELDFGAGEVEFADAFLSYKPGNVEFIVGQHNNYQSLEELTSSLHTSFIERAAFTDAFGFERRIGVSAQYVKNDFLLQGGFFTDSIADLNAASIGDDNNSYGFDTRAVFMPKMGSNQLHLASSFHWRDLNDAPDPRYRQRPAVHTTDVRFIDTGALAGAERETGYGLEAAGIFGSFHVAGEAYWQRVSQAGFENPNFFGAYTDVGYFLTGETRGYKGGKFDRTKVLKPFGSGGFGAISINGRFDYLDLSDATVLGGKQSAYQASINWKPTDYVLFGLNYAHILYDDAAISADGDRDYSVDMIGLRSQIDF